MIALERRVSPEALAWLQDAVAQVERDPARIAALFPQVGRRVGREPLDPAASPDDPHVWTVDDAARTRLLLALGDAVAEALPELYRYGDAAERRGILRALAQLPVGEEATGLVEDAIRTNDTRLLAAALGPYATAHLPDAAYDQAVLKCVFAGVPIAPLHGLHRVTADGARMLAALVHERVAAGRDVPAEVWPVIDRHPPGAEIAAIEAELGSRSPRRRAAAQRALGGRA
jgi:hypothetical protein